LDANDPRINYLFCPSSKFKRKFVL